MRVSIPRISSVKLKNGAKLHILRNTAAEDCRHGFTKDCQHILKARGQNMAGFAIVAWAVDGSVSTALRIADSRQVGTMMAPDFVKTALIDYIASEP